MLFDKSVMRKRNRLNKNKKKNWRKADITDVEEFLENTALQERTGGLVSKKENSELFFVDKDIDNVDTKNNIVNKPLKCYSSLLPQFQTPHPMTANKNFTKNKKLSKKKMIIIHDKLQVSTNPKKFKTENKHLYDLWNDSDDKKNTTATNKIEDEFFSKITRKVRVKAPRNYHKRPYEPEIKPVDPAHPGASYNPTYADHQQLLKDAMEYELSRKKSEDRLYRTMDSKFPNKAISDKDYLDEMSCGLFDKDNEPHNNYCELNNDSDMTHRASVMRENKKTEKQRRKEIIEKQKKSISHKKKKMNIRNNKIYSLKKIKDEIHQHEMSKMLRQRLRNQLKEKNRTKTKKLGPYKFEEPSLDLNLSNELKGNLRQLKPEGNLLADRYASLCKRNIIETRKHVKKYRRYKPKAFDKKSYRD